MKEEFYESAGFITAFLVACLLIGTFLDDKILFYFLLLVLTSMLIFNVSAITGAVSSLGTGGGGNSSGGGGGRL